jgi:hypothetical protein
VAEVLAEVEAQRTTIPTHRSASDLTATTPVRHARQKIQRRNSMVYWIAGGLAALLIVGVAAVLLISTMIGQGIGASGSTPTLAASTATSGGGQTRPTGVTSEAPSPEPTSAEGGTLTEAPIIVPSSTATTTSEAPQTFTAMLAYTERGFYLINIHTAKSIEIEHLAFEAIDSTGVPSQFRFGVTEWLAHFGIVEPGKCNGIEIILTSAFELRPGECRDFNALITPDVSSTAIFWVQRDGISEFRVLWDGSEIRRCPTGSGTCGIDIPLTIP